MQTTTRYQLSAKFATRPSKEIRPAHRVILAAVRQHHFLA
jgi:hypothetical protein